MAALAELSVEEVDGEGEEVGMAEAWVGAALAELSVEEVDGEGKEVDGEGKEVVVAEAWVGPGCRRHTPLRRPLHPHSRQSPGSTARPPAAEGPSALSTSWFGTPSRCRHHCMRSLSAHHSCRGRRKGRCQSHTC